MMRIVIFFHFGHCKLYEWFSLLYQQLTIFHGFCSRIVWVLCWHWEQRLSIRSVIAFGCSEVDGAWDSFFVRVAMSFHQCRVWFRHVDRLPVYEMLFMGCHWKRLSYRR